MGKVFKAIKNVVGGVVDVAGALVGADTGDSLPKISMPQAPTALKGDAGAADKAATETAARRSEEEKRRRAALGRKSTFAGAQTGLIGPAPTGKKKLLGQ